MAGRSLTILSCGVQDKVEPQAVPRVDTELITSQSSSPDLAGTSASPLAAPAEAAAAPSTDSILDVAMGDAVYEDGTMN